MAIEWDRTTARDWRSSDGRFFIEAQYPADWGCRLTDTVQPIKLRYTDLEKAKAEAERRLTNDL